MHRQTQPAIRTPSRSGNAVIMAMCVFTVAAVLVATSIDSAVAGRQAATWNTDQQRALAALDAVLARHESEVVQLANQGDPAIIADWTNNYGADQIADVEVRWKVEPVRTPPKTPGGADLPFTANPSPDPNWVPPTTPANGDGVPYWRPNDTMYLFRIAGEARIGKDAAGLPTTMVQGARYASVQKEPLFRYVIFYAQTGAKGDLEMAHADPVNIQGAVHTNGSLYLGGGMKVNDKLARIGSLDGNNNPTDTKIGPDVNNARVRVNGVDGIFRISKPLMFSIVNGLPLTNTTVSGVNPDTTSFTGAIAWDADSSYSLDNRLIGNETTLPNLASVSQATDNGRRINPYRIKDKSGAITENKATSEDGQRTINGTIIRGVPYTAYPDPKTANDARDDQRATDPEKWEKLSLLSTAPGFDGMARSRKTGQMVKQLPERMRNRGLEAQRLTYIDYDSDDQTDQHEFARPRFMKDDGNATCDYPSGTGKDFPEWSSRAQVVEDPGQYLRYALGTADAYHVRYDDGIGWYASDLTGSFPADPITAGLIIRERPVPNTGYWPGSGGADNIVDPNDPRWLPFSYGKHWYPTAYHFTSCDISDQVFYAGANPYATDRINTTPMARSTLYAPGGGGSLTISTAQNPVRNSNNPNLAAVDTGGGHDLKPYYYAQNWRFVHLAKAKAGSTAGLQLTLFNDLPSGTAALALAGTPIPVTAPAGGVVGKVSLSGVTPNPTGYRSARFQGFLKPAASCQHQFKLTVGSSQKARAWVGTGPDSLVANAWDATAENYITLSQDKLVPITVEWCNDNNSSPSVKLEWKQINPTPGAYAEVPDTAFVQAEANPGFAKADFTAIQMRIDNPQALNNPAHLKVGIMLRDGAGGAAPLLSGTDAYVFLGFSPTRGFFTERRPVRHLVDQRSYGTYYIGNGTDAGGTAANATGEIGQDSKTKTGITRTAYLKEVDRTTEAVVDGTPQYPTKDITESGGWVTPPNFSGTTSKDIGGGKVWTIIDAFAVGQKTITKTYTPRARTQVTRTKSRSLALAMSGQKAPLLSSDAGVELTFFTANTNTGKYTTNSAIKNLAYSTSYDDLADPYPPITQVDKWFLQKDAAGEYTRVRRTFVASAMATNTAYGTAKNVSKTSGDAKTVWGSPRINKNGTVVTATLDDLKTVTGVDFSGMNPTLPTVNAPSFTAGEYPAYPAAPAYSAVTLNLPDLLSGSGRTFQVLRSGGKTVTFYLNSFVTGSATWFAAPGQPQWLPWNAWPLTDTLGDPLPKTQGFRPDQYYGAGPVTSGTPKSTPALTSDAKSMTDDIKPADLANKTEIWLRIEKDATGTLRFKYFAGTAKPTGATDAGWTEIHAATGTCDIAGWGAQLLAGPAVQSGDVNTIVTPAFTNMQVELGATTVNDTTWSQSASGKDDIAAYLCSQYQVFWGTREITQDFFTWLDADNGNRRIAKEDWIWNPREFWSQSRWWEHTDSAGNRIQKDVPVSPATTFTATRIRQAWAKSTLLTLDFAALQNYLRKRTLLQATTKATSMSALVQASGPAVTASDDYTLADRFNGLIYAARTNRYPWNPNAQPAMRPLLTAGASVLNGTDDAGINPYAPCAECLPNNSQTEVDTEVAAKANNARCDAWDPVSPVDSTHILKLGSKHKLQPYDSTTLPQAPPIKPQDFHEGFRIVNGASIDWQYPVTGRSSSSKRDIGASGTKATTWAYGTAPAFGTSKLSFVTPNALFVQGNLNVDQHLVSTGGATVAKNTPFAIMADSVTVASNAWNDTQYQVAGLTVTDTAGAGSVSGSGTLACKDQGPVASDTEVNAAIATHNQPTTRDRIAEGQAAPFVDTMQFLENWNRKEITYTGSLAVMDSRRYTRAFLLDVYKTYGQTPFGIVGGSDWLGKFTSMNLYGAAVSSADWQGQSPIVYSEPKRVYKFNYDLTTAEGTPPFAPFGVSTGGVGGWVKIIR